MAEPAAEGSPALPRRRERLRAATTAEIISTARRLLLQAGPQGISLRAIAREMGMTAPGLYRYFNSYEELIQHVVADIFTELHQAIEAAIEAEVIPADATPDEKAAHLGAKLVASCRAFRNWALTHPGEFGMIFGVPLPGYPDPAHDDIAKACADRFAGTFFTLFIQLFDTMSFPVPADDQIDPRLRDQLVRKADWPGALELPLGAHVVFLRCWTLLYGAVALEVLGHLDFALEDSSPMFEYTLSDLARLVGLRYPFEG